MVSLASLADRFISAGERVRPLWLRKWLFSLLFSFYAHLNRLQAIVLQLRLPVSRVSGESKNGERLCLLFVGLEAFSLYLSDLIFKKPPQVEQVGKVFVWRLKHIPHVVPSDVDAVVVSCDPFYQRWLEKAGLFVFPHFIDMVLNVSDSPDVFYKKSNNSAKADMKKVEKYGYSYEVFSDVDHLRFFYDRMYLPLIQTRYGDAPIYTPPFFFFKWLRLLGYRLLLVKDDRGDFVSGCYHYMKNDYAINRYLGVIDGDVALIRKGAESATYWFFIIHPKDPNVSTVNFGGVRPFFNDGLFQYKRKWGMKAEVCDLVTEIFGLRIVSEREPLKQFLILNPFIGMNEKNDLIEFVFVDKKTFTDTMRNQAEKRFQTPGVNELRFIEL
jgi:hypothetical protein